MTEWIQHLRSKIGNELTFVISAGAWIEDEGGRVLLQRRKPDEECWGLPGGIMDLGESALETAVREVYEETGLIVTAKALIGIYTKYFETLDNGDQCQCISAIFLMNVTGGDLYVDNKETYELKYFDKSSMPELHSAQHRQVAKDVKEGKVPYYR